MNNHKQYLIWCSNCGRQTGHFIIKQNLRKGVILNCSHCGNSKKNYNKLQFLKEYQPIAQESDNNTKQEHQNASNGVMSNTLTKLEKAGGLVNGKTK